MGKKTTERKRPLEAWQIEDAARLRKLFDEAQQSARDRGERFTQETFGEKANMSTNMVWQYTSAHRPLNLIAAAKFAKALSVDVSDFSPTLATQVDQVAETKRPTSIAAAPAPERRMRLQWVDDWESDLLSHARATDDHGRFTIMSVAEEQPQVSFDGLAAHQPKDRPGQS